MELIQKLEKIKIRFDQITQQLSDSSYANDRDKMIALTRERSDLEEIIQAYEKYSNIIKNIEGYKEIIAA